MLAAELTMVASSSGFISHLNSLGPFGMILIHLVWHFRLGSDGTHLDQILWRCAVSVLLCFPSVTLVYTSPHCCFP